jgi:hypothetical protein
MEFFQCTEVETRKISSSLRIGLCPQSGQAELFVTSVRPMLLAPYIAGYLAKWPAGKKSSIKVCVIDYKNL